MYFPVLFNLGPINLYTYGFFIALAFLVAGLIIIWQAKKRKLDSSKLLSFSPYVIVAIMIGARGYYILQHFEYYRNHIFEIFAFWNGGLSMYGGVIVGFLALLLFLRKERKKQKWRWLDVLGIGLLIGSAIGRIGCTLNGCCFGDESHFGPGVTNGFLEDGVSRYPTQIYEAILYFLSFVVVLGISLKWFKKIAPGALFFLAIILHSLTRFSVEFLRYSDSYIGIFKTAQVVTLVIVIVSLVIFFITRKTRGKLNKS